MKESRYMTRAMKSRDPRFQRILGKLGHVAIGVLESVPAPAVETVEVEVTDNVETVAVLDPDGVAPDETAVPSNAERPAKADKPARRTPSAKLDHDDSGKAGGSRKKADTKGRYKRRDMKAED